MGQTGHVGWVAYIFEGKAQSSPDSMIRFFQLGVSSRSQLHAQGSSKDEKVAVCGLTLGWQHACRVPKAFYFLFADLLPSCSRG